LALEKTILTRRINLCSTDPTIPFILFRRRYAIKTAILKW